MKNACLVLGGRFRRRWENIRIDFKEMRSEDMDWTDLVENRDE
jgi:hypothetical protein